MSNLTIQGTYPKTLDSRDVARMVQKQHKNLLRDINEYISQMKEANEVGSTLSSPIIPEDYFIEATYIDSQNRIQPKYDITKIGCDFIANKLTGVKGTGFTALYTKKFDAMEKALISDNKNGLEERAKRLEIRDRYSRAKQANVLTKMAKDFEIYLSVESVQQLLSAATTILTGGNILPLPMVDRTYTAEEIAQEAGLSANMIGRIANKNNLKTSEYGITVLDKSPYSNKQVPSFRYNEAGRQELLRIVALEKGVNPCQNN